jgi:GT2 family glycosyltransferase
MTQVLVVVLNWNELDYTRCCLKSLFAQQGVSYDVLVVDNDSEEDPTLALKREFPGISVLRNTKNLGVAGGRNIGIRYALQCGYEYVLLIDHDAYADSKMLSNLVAAANKNPDTGILGPKIFLDNSDRVIWRAGCTSWKWTYLHAGNEIIQRICRSAGKFPPPLFDTTRGAGQKDIGQFDFEQEVCFLIGCTQLIRAEVFRQIGLLDERFFPYGSEDIDFCARIKRAGWKIRYVPKAQCWHRVDSNLNDDYNRTFYNAKNILLLARKNLTSAYFWLLFIPDFAFLSIPLIMLENLIKKRPQRQKALFDAIVWNINDIRKRGILVGDKKPVHPPLPRQIDNKG